jgi:hypothetical protein
MESIVFAPTQAIQRFGQGPTAQRATRIVTVVAEVALLFTFAIAGTIFFGLAIASPVGVPIAARQGITLSSGDLAAARELGSMWWLFAAGTVLSFGAAVVTIGNLLQRLGGSTEE